MESKSQKKAHAGVSKRKGASGKKQLLFNSLVDGRNGRTFGSITNKRLPELEKQFRRGLIDVISKFLNSFNGLIDVLQIYPRLEL